MGSRKTAPAIAALLLCWGVPVATAAAVDFPSVPVPEGASGEIVTKHMVYNGVNMRASRFEVERPIDEVKAFYREERGRELVDTPMRGKSVLGYKTGGYYVTVELTPSGELTRGQIGVTQLPGKKDVIPERGAGFARMPKTLVIEDIIYMDTAQKARTLNMRNAYSPLQNDRFYDRTYRTKGYVRQASANGCTASSAKCVSYYAKGDSRVVLAFVRDRRGTQVAAIVE